LSPFAESATRNALSALAIRLSPSGSRHPALAIRLSPSGSRHPALAIRVGGVSLSPGQFTKHTPGIGLRGFGSPARPGFRFQQKPWTAYPGKDAERR
ncbi:MAG: hypothetical protein M3494_03590, partial [Actinomycetota bacterium]|nr:hypothetical protein [Actinomycetota bacterium]